MYKGLLIHGSDAKAQPMDTKKENETEKDKAENTVKSTRK